MSFGFSYGFGYGLALVLILVGVKVGLGDGLGDILVAVLARLREDRDKNITRRAMVREGRRVESRERGCRL